MIRKALEKDVDKILEMLFEVHDVHAKGRPDIFKVGERKFKKEDVLELIKNVDKPIYVYDDGEIKGYVFVEWNIVEESESRHGRKELFIEDFCVLEKYRRQGVATKLFKYIEELANSEKCDVVTLNVWALNKEAISFYEKMGMSPLRTIMEKIV